MANSDMRVRVEAVGLDRTMEEQYNRGARRIRRISLTAENPSDCGSIHPLLDALRAGFRLTHPIRPKRMRGPLRYAPPQKPPLARLS